jgi:shikimate dehydrogenase
MNLYGLIGFPLTHSFSKKYFTEKFKDEGIKDSVYELFEIKDVKELPAIIKNNPGLKGLNVTIPHKEAILPLLDELDTPVKNIKAVNVIKISNGKLKGYNSDFHGFKISLQRFLGQEAKVKALVLGTGGAAKAVRAALEDLRIHYWNVSRTAGEDILGYEQLDKDIINSFKLIINTSPVGMYPKVEEAPPIPYEFLTKEHYLFDLVYNPEETLFMKNGKLAGARTKNGLEMLSLQAEKAWEIWTNDEFPPTGTSKF